ncbi:MAG: hypothetical protein QOF58_5076, partial [Pseudonocardiales bacterium]|nr:hypothetical protein [Pseudonocardiales bacterium]
MRQSGKPRRTRWLVAAATAALVLPGAGAGVADASTPSVTTDQAAATPGCGKAPTLRNGKLTIQSGGKNRSFILSIPDNYDNTRQYRLVFGFHWYGGTAEQVAGGGSD